MLKIILDTNLFRTNLKGLEKYEFSSLYEDLIKYVNESKIKDAALCMTETSIKEFAKQMAEDYQKNVVDGYTKAFNIMKDSLPVFEIKFRDKYDFMDEFLNGMLERLESLNVEIIDTLPTKQEGGMKMTEVLNKTIKDIAPFDKNHNRNLKDAFISESVNSKAQDNRYHNYLFITCNAKDFRENTVRTNNYYMEFLDNNSKDKMMALLNVFNKHGAYVDEETFYKEFLYSDKVREGVKNFLEINIIEGQYYDENIPEIKKCDDSHYALTYEVNEEKTAIEIKFTIIAGESEYAGGLEYSLVKDQFPLIRKYIYYTDESGEEVCVDEF